MAPTKGHSLSRALSLFRNAPSPAWEPPPLCCIGVFGLFVVVLLIRLRAARIVLISHFELYAKESRFLGRGAREKQKSNWSWFPIVFFLNGLGYCLRSRGVVVRLVWRNEDASPRLLRISLAMFCFFLIQREVQGVLVKICVLDGPSGFPPSLTLIHQ